MKKPTRILNCIILAATANCVLPLRSLDAYWLTVILAIAFLMINVIPSQMNRHISSKRLRICADGCEVLVLFLLSSVLSVVYHIIMAFELIPSQWQLWVLSAAVALCVESLIFWNGIIRVYLTSVQLGVRHRVVAAICGWIPVANLWALSGMIRIVSDEIRFEEEKNKLDAERRSERICATRYPLLLVHGVFFRDYKLVNYWGRIPAELQRNGAQIYYGGHQSAASVPDSAAELTARIKSIVESTGCGKVNIIAHSKGGLDCRYAVSNCGAAPYVASITTINTPHRGCIFADYLLDKIPQSTQKGIADKYNAAMRRLGDKDPDFMSAVRDLTASKCEELNSLMPDVEGIYCQSVGSKLNRAVNGKFPLNISYPLVKHFDGANDGLVAESSFEWGEKYTFLTTDGKRGISHGDVIDMNRENIPGFDVREFYVSLVSELKNKGY